MSVTIEQIHQAQQILAEHMTPAPLVRSYALERELKLQGDRRVWIKTMGGPQSARSSSWGRCTGCRSIHRGSMVAPSRHTPRAILLLDFRMRGIDSQRE